MKVASEGGTPVALPEAYFRVQDISPDGTRLMGLSWHEQQRRVVLAEYSLKDNALQLLPDYPTNALYMPDGGMAGVQRMQGKSVVGIWPQGGSFKAVAAPFSEIIYAGAVSGTGKIAMSRGQATNDVVLMTSK